MTGGGFQIRPEKAQDVEAVAALTTRAFAGNPHASGTEADIIARLRARGALAVSLVAEAGGGLVGHVAFSPTNHPLWFALGPISVAPGLQKRGIGTALIGEGFAALRKQAAAGCILMGDPAYYGRFGFLVTPEKCPPGLPGEYFMTMALDGRLPDGLFEFHPAFFG